MKFYRYGEYCLCPVGGRLPENAIACESHFAPLVFLVDRDPSASRGFYPISRYAELEESESCALLQKQPAGRPHELDSWLGVHGACVLNTAFGRCFEVLDRWVHAKKNRLKLTLVGLGDVGGTILTGLKLLGREIAEIGVYDPNEVLCARYCMELNQVLPELDNAPLCPVVSRTKEELFDCDLFLFAASLQVPAVGSQVDDVRMVQYERNRNMLRSYAKQARQAGFTGLFCQISDPVDHLCRSVFLESNRDNSGKEDWNGLLPEQIQGYGLGVMRARAVYLAGQNAINFSKGCVYGPHGKGLVVANAPGRRYNDALSRFLTQQVVEANLAVRALGFKPYIAPGLSSGCVSILRTLRSQIHDSAVSIGGVWFGCRSRLTRFGVQLQQQTLDGTLFDRIQESYQALRDFDYDR